MYEWDDVIVLHRSESKQWCRKTGVSMYTVHGTQRGRREGVNAHAEECLGDHVVANGRGNLHRQLLLARSLSHVWQHSIGYYEPRRTPKVSLLNSCNIWLQALDPVRKKLAHLGRHVLSPPGWDRLLIASLLGCLARTLSISHCLLPAHCCPLPNHLRA